MNQSPESKRLAIVLAEFEGGQEAFAKTVKVDQSSISRMINGKRELSLKVIKGVCYALGYSPEWFINGTGSKKKRPDDVKLITEISMLRAEMDIMLQMNKRLQARMDGYENELNLVKNR